MAGLFYPKKLGKDYWLHLGCTPGACTSTPVPEVSEEDTSVEAGAASFKYFMVTALDFVTFVNTSVSMVSLSKSLPQTNWFYHSIALPSNVLTS